jgi:flagellar protein FlgJ
MDGVEAAVRAGGAGNGKIVEASRQFEAYFIQQLLEEMRKTIPREHQAGFGSDIYDSIIDQALAQKIAEQKGIGLADQITRALGTGK